MFKRIISSLRGTVRQERIPKSGPHRLRLAVEMLENRSLLTALSIASETEISDFTVAEPSADFDALLAESVEFDAEQAFQATGQLALNDTASSSSVSSISPLPSNASGQSRPPISAEMSVSAAEAVFGTPAEWASIRVPAIRPEDMAIALIAIDVAESSVNSSTGTASRIDSVMELYAYQALDIETTTDANDTVAYSLDVVSALDNDGSDEAGVFVDEGFIDIGEDEDVCVDIGRELDQMVGRSRSRIRTWAQSLDEGGNINPLDPTSSENHEGNNTQSSRCDTPPQDGDERESEQSSEAEHGEPTTFQGIREGMVELLHDHGLASATLADMPVPVRGVLVQRDGGVDYLKLDGPLARYQAFEIASSPGSTCESAKAPSTRELPRTGHTPNADSS